ncbi:hypothetical protein [Salibacterium salarium]|uniref:hypothetical protein n=1 Tax=Salibacterium salarium TaxID=284579 RepID=UPI0016399B91|nr:hypothetical protein [Salibacterium salarium]
MVETMVEFMLGPYLTPVSNWYIENQLLINSIVVFCGMVSIFKRNYSNKEEKETGEHYQ